MKKKFAAVAIAAAAGLVLSACSSGGGSTSTGGDGAETAPLTIGEFSDVTSWDPALADIGFDGPYLSAVYDSLLTVDGDGEPQPGVAEKWDVSDDFLTVTLHLRDGVEFSDGEALDADAVVKNLEYLKDGARSGEAYDKVDSFEAVDDDTVAIHMTERDDTMLYFMGLGRSWMAAPDAIDAGTLAKNPVGSGPYTLDDSSVAGSEYTFTKVDDYWDADAFQFDPLVIKPIQDPTARDNAMLAGQVDLIYGDLTAIEQAEDHDWNVAKKISSWVGVQFTDRDGDKFEAIGKDKVRQAINYAFNGQQVLDSVGNDLGVYTNQIFPADGEINSSDLDEMYEYNMDKAKKLMKEAGYPNGFDVTMPMTQVFQMWQPSINEAFKALGINVTWKDMQYMDYQKTAATYAMFPALIAIDSNEVANVQRQIHTKQWYNPTPDVDAYPDVEEQIDKVLDADPDDQTAEIEKLNELVTEKAWFGVLYQAENVYVSTPEIEVTPVTGMMFPTLRQISYTG